MSNSWNWPIAAGYLFAILLRVALLLNDGIRDVIESRVEVSTPVTAFQRMKEGAFLWEHGASPYSGDALHQPPLLLLLSEFAHAFYQGSEHVLSSISTGASFIFLTRVIFLPCMYPFGVFPQ